MQTIRTIAAIAVLGIVLLLPFASQTLAQQTPPQQPPPQQTDLNETQLRSFAKAYVEIEKILKTYEPQLQEATTPEEGKHLQNEELLKINQVLTEEGMDVQSYQRVVQIVNADEGLRKKVLG